MGFTGINWNCHFYQNRLRKQHDSNSIKFYRSKRPLSVFGLTHFFDNIFDALRIQNTHLRYSVANSRNCRTRNFVCSVLVANQWCWNWNMSTVYWLQRRRFSSVFLYKPCSQYVKHEMKQGTVCSIYKNTIQYACIEKGWPEGLPHYVKNSL